MKNKKLYIIYSLCASIYFLQGIETLPGLAMFAYLKDVLHFSESKVMYLSGIIGIAWLIKPLWGFLVDKFFNKKSWILTSIIGSILISLGFGLNPVLTIPFILILGTLGNLTTAVRDVSIDGVSCVEGKENACCANMQSVQWGSLTIAGIFTGFFGGYIADHFSYKMAYLCLIPVYIAMLFLLKQYKEKIIVKEKIEKWWNNFKILGNKKLLLAALFIFLYNYAPSFGTPLRYIQLDRFGWSYTFLGTLEGIGSIVQLGAAILFFKYSKKLPLKKTLIFSVILGAITSLCYLYFTPISAIVYYMLFGFIGMLIHLLVLSWMAKTSIAGYESISFALLCSVFNLAKTASTLSGGWLYPKIGLNWMIIISALCSFACLPLIPHLKLEK